MKALLLLLCLVSAACLATDHGDYVLTHAPGDRNQFSVISSHYGRWYGYLSTEAPEQPSRTHVVSFSFYTPDYFTEGNRGHFGVGLRANSTFPAGDVARIEARGRGVIFGNATEYGNQAPGCTQTKTVNVITFEVWWRDDRQRNCVMGWTESEQLENGQYYRLTIESTRNNGLYIAYTLERYRFGTGWAVVGRDSMFDFTPSDTADGGIFLAEVFSTHAWTFYIWDLKDYWR